MRKTKQIRSAVVCCCLCVCVCVCVHLFIYFRVEKQTRHGRHMNNVEKTLKVKKTQSIYSQQQQQPAAEQILPWVHRKQVPPLFVFYKSRVLQSHAGCVCVCVCGDCVMRVYFSNSLWELIHYLHYPVLYYQFFFVFLPLDTTHGSTQPRFLLAVAQLNRHFVILFYFIFSLYYSLKFDSISTCAFASFHFCYLVINHLKCSSKPTCM